MIVTRKALRMRRINSLKRQISIKEKMLEVGARYRAWLLLLLVVVVVLSRMLLVLLLLMVHTLLIMVPPANISHRCMPLTWLSLPLPWIFKM